MEHVEPDALDYKDERGASMDCRLDNPWCNEFGEMKIEGKL